MMKTIESIWFEFEEWEKYDEDNDNSDVIFELSDGTKWSTTFFTCNNILSLFQKNKASGERLGGLYFCATDMILVEKLNHQSILKVLEHMVATDEIKTTCSLIID